MLMELDAEWERVKNCEVFLEACNVDRIIWKR